MKPGQVNPEFISTTSSIVSFAEKLKCLVIAFVKLDRIGEVGDFHRNVRNPMQRVLWLGRSNKSLDFAITRFLNLSTYDFAALIPNKEHVAYFRPLPPPVRVKKVEFKPGL